jgi:hypothetical protein
MNEPRSPAGKTHPAAYSEGAYGLPAQRPFLHKLPLGGQRDSYFFVSNSYNPEIPPELTRDAGDWLMAGKPAE